MEALLERMEGARSVVGSMRALREFLEAGGSLDRPGVLEILSRLPRSWARRRALTGILRSGYPREFDDAVRLLDEIETPSGRGWCLTALAQGRDLNLDQLGRLCEIAGSAIVARRLRALQSARH